MATIFEKSIGNRTYTFNQVFYPNDELYYNITFDNNSQKVTFRMKRDESKMWKLQAQKLPEDVYDVEMDLGDAIDDNLNT